MGSSKSKIKQGMGGSNGGRSRWEYTEILKNDSKKMRRVNERLEIQTEIKEAKGDTLCNRTACQTDHGVFMWNKTMRAFYCYRCARLINDSAGDLGPLCVEDPQRKFEYDAKKLARRSSYGKLGGLNV